MAVKRRILLVEDSQNWQNSLTELLEADYKVSLAESPKEAFEELEKQQPAIAIVDIRLQGTDSGLDLIGSIRKEYPTLPIIAISAVKEIMTYSRVSELYGDRRIAAFVDKVTFDGFQFLDLVAKVLQEAKQTTPKQIFLAHDYQGGHKVFGDKLADLLRKLGYTVYRPIDDPRGGNLWLRIQSRIDASALGLFEISSFNPNVCFELGYTLGKRKPYYTLLSSEPKPMPIPNILSGELRVEYISELELLGEIVKILKPTEVFEEKFAYVFVNPRKIHVQSRSALVIVPHETFQRESIETAVISALKQRGFKPISFIAEKTNDLIKTYQLILESNLIVGGIIGKANDLAKYANAEVMLPLGIALGAGRELIILQQGNDGPSDLKGLAHEYEGVAEAVDQLKVALDELPKKRVHPLKGSGARSSR